MVKGALRGHLKDCAGLLVAAIRWVGATAITWRPPTFGGRFADYTVPTRLPTYRRASGSAETALGSHKGGTRAMNTQERALGRIQAWASHYKDESRSGIRETMKLIHEEAEAALAAREGTERPDEAISDVFVGGLEGRIVRAQAERDARLTTEEARERILIAIEGARQALVRPGSIVGDLFGVQNTDEWERRALNGVSVIALEDFNAALDKALPVRDTGREYKRQRDSLHRTHTDISRECER